jgi:16S rRNA processing protein RimM
MIVMGKVAAAQGILGWVKIQVFTENLDALSAYKTLFMAKPEKPWQEYKLLESRPHNKVLIARLDGINDRTAAEKLRGMLIAVPRSWLPDTGTDEYYWSDLTGMSVVSLQGEMLGVVDHLLDMGANDILVVKHDDREILIPFLSHVVQHVDLPSKLIRVDWQADY